MTPPTSAFSPTPVTACGRVDAGLLEEPHVQRHAADVGGGHPVDERRRQLRLDGRHERDLRSGTPPASPIADAM